jgi:hypothetical protein
MSSTTMRMTLGGAGSAARAVVAEQARKRERAKVRSREEWGMGEMVRRGTAEAS